MGYQGRYSQQKPQKAQKQKKSGGGKKVVLIVLLVLLVLIVGIAIAGVLYWNSLLSLMTRPDESIGTQPTMSQEEMDQMLSELGVATGPVELETTAPIETSPEDTWPQIVSGENVTNIMVVGQAARAGEDYKLSDTMILCSINREKKTLTLVSFLRDSYVTIPAYAGHTQGRARINVCYHLGSLWTGSSLGGMEMLAKCIEQNYGIPIDHTVEINFESFEKVVDAMGGIEIELTEEEVKYMHEFFDYDWMDAGMNVMDGDIALNYARARQLGNGDFGRTARQRNVIKAIIKKATTMGLMDLHKTVTEVLPMIATDMENSEITNYVWEFLPMLKDLNIVSEQCPTENAANSYYSASIDIYGDGFKSYVQVPNTTVNRDYFFDILGLTEAE